MFTEDPAAIEMHNSACAFKVKGKKKKKKEVQYCDFLNWGNSIEWE
jgi:hypothetical protein